MVRDRINVPSLPVSITFLNWQLYKGGRINLPDPENRMTIHKFQCPDERQTRQKQNDYRVPSAVRIFLSILRKYISL